MADQTNQQQNITPNPNQGVLQNLKYSNDTLKNIDMSLRRLLQDPNGLGNVRKAPTESQSNFANNKWKTVSRKDSSEYDPKIYKGTGDIYKDFTNAFKKQLLDSVAGDNFKKGLKSAMSTFTERFGLDLRNIPAEAGKALSKKVVKTLGDSKAGQALNKKLGSLGNSILNRAFDGQKDQASAQAAKQGILDAVKAFRSGGQSGVGELAGQASGTLGKILAGSGGKAGAAAAQGGMSGAGGMLAGNGAAGALAKGAATLGPYALLIVAVAYTIVKVLGPALKGLAEMAKSLGKSFNREEEMRKKMMENAKTRQEADMKYLAEQPFKILEEAAQKWADAWDQNLRKIGQTQGYDKESVYALYEGYAERLREDNLASAIPATEIIDKLATVLDSGLSGQAAEEFAYVATKLNAAIPNQDFFGYVDTYASIAANAIAQGKSQTEALNIANSELELFASNLTYSSRELAGGFSTGLKNSSSLFKQATQIAQSAKSGNIGEISGVLTSVSAIIGARAPDLADSLVTNIVQAAIGGNSSSLVALRSLAGINAGNTEFLKMMAEDPQQIFSQLFTKLGNLQNMSPDAYMEVAEGLADVFGIDKAAFARVDFADLANTISDMQVNFNSLDQNLALLESGQTTASKEQLRNQEIQRVITEEGLQYVIDSEAGRMIQQHMWDEQRANAMMENEYAVNLQGSALVFLEGIRKTMTTLMNFLNPIGFIAKGVSNMTQTIAESVGNEQDLKEILELGTVGSNSKEFYNLTTRGKNLGLTKSMVEMMGGTKGVESLNKLAKLTRTAGNVTANVLGTMLTGVPLATADEFNMLNDARTAYKGGSSAVSTAKTRYNWGIVGKSVATALTSSTINTNALGRVLQPTSTAAAEYATSQANANFQKFLDTAEKAAAGDKTKGIKAMSYDQWVNTAKSFGISDYSAALEAYGRTEQEIKNYFEEAEAAAGAAEKENREQAIRQYWGYDGGPTNGKFYSAVWFPFFGDSQKYDTRMTAVDTALSTIQDRIGLTEKHTVIGGIEELSRKLGVDNRYTVISVLEKIEGDINSTFVKNDSWFQECLRYWHDYITKSMKDYSTATGKKNAAWSDFAKSKEDQQNQATLALANALGVFTAQELQNMDPQLQTNVLLGQIVVLLQTIMQQNNSVAGGLSLIDTISALGTGAVNKK